MKKNKIVAIITMLAILSTIAGTAFAATTSTPPILTTTIETTASDDSTLNSEIITQDEGTLIEEMEYQILEPNSLAIIYVENVNTGEQYPVILEVNIVPSCSKITVKNSSATVTKWQILDTKGTVLYTSGKYLAGQTCTIDLAKANIPANTKFKLKAAVTGKDSTCGTTFEYIPGTNSFQTFKLTGTAFKTSLKYLGGFSL